MRPVSSEAYFISIVSKRNLNMTELRRRDRTEFFNVFKLFLREVDEDNVLDLASFQKAKELVRVNVCEFANEQINRLLQ